MSQREIARRAGRRPESFSHWKAGRGIELESFNAMNDALDVPADVAMLIGQYAELPDDLILEICLLVRKGKKREVQEALRRAGY